MGTYYRDHLVAAILEADTEPAYVGLALKTLAQDIEERKTPLTVSYADLKALEDSITERLDRFGGDAKIVDRLNKLRTSLDQAVEHGVITTSSPVRGRIAGG